MPINEQIQRLQQAKEDLKNKLIEKNVVVEDELLISDYPPLLDEIQTGVDTSDATATSEDIRYGKTAYVNDVKVVGAIEDYDGSYDGDVEEGLIIPTGTYQVTNNGEYDITQYAKVNVNVAGSGSEISFAEVLIPDYSNTKDTNIRGYAFYKCTKLISVNTPNVTQVYEYAFYQCTALTNINMLNLKIIGTNAFSSCTALTNINMPNVTNISNGAFYSCSNLTSVNIANVLSIGMNAFGKSYMLKAVVITQTTRVCSLSNKNAFENCYHILGTVDATYNPTGAKDGYIYVPDSLVDSYKSATNWSAYADQIKPLSELPQEYKELYNIA